MRFVFDAGCVVHLASGNASDESDGNLQNTGQCCAFASILALPPVTISLSISR